MCYTLFLSTDSEEDLRGVGHGLFFLEEPTEADVGKLRLLEHAHKWYLAGRYGGCSCHFRHLGRGSSELDFAPPVDWMPEEAEELESTAAFYDFMHRLVGAGHQLDIFDIFAGTPTDAEFASLDVSLAEVRRESFRFFEDFRFRVSV